MGTDVMKTIKHLLGYRVYHRDTVGRMVARLNEYEKMLNERMQQVVVLRTAVESSKQAIERHKRRAGGK